MIANNVLIAVALLGQALLSCFCRLLGGSWFSPGSFFSLYWLVFMSYPWFLVPEYPIQASGVLWIFISTCAFCTGSIGAQYFFIYYQNYPARNTELNNALTFPWLNKILFFSIIIGLCAPLYLLYSYGYLNNSLFSLKYLLTISNKFSVMRYHEGFSPPVLSRITVVFAYTATLLGGIRWLSATRKREKVLAIFSFVPALLMTVILTTKSSMMFALLLFFSSFIAGSIFALQGRLAVWRFLLPVVTGGTILLFVIFFADNLRVGRMDKSLLDVWHHLRSAFAGHMAVFSYWFEYYQGDEVKLGQYTFAGLFNMLGLAHRESGLYVEPTPLPMLNSNIYTIFRGLIMDFSMFGSLLFLCVFGWFAELSYGFVCRQNYLALPLLILFYTITFWSFVVSVMNYNTIIVSFIILMFFYLMRLLRGR